MKLDLTDLFLQSPTAHAFLRAAFLGLQASSRSFTFEKFAARAGFGNKSSAHLIFSGKRSINLKNCDQIVLGLGLTGTLANAFRLLVESEQKRPNPTVQRRLEACRKKLRLKRIPSSQFVPKSPDWPLVFAAIPAGGASAKGLAARTRLGDAAVQFALNEMELVGLVARVGSTYQTAAPTVQFGELTQSVVLQLFFQSVAQKARARVLTDLHRSDSLFFASATSVKKKDLERLTRELQNLLAEYAAGIEDQNGDEIVLIQASMIPH